MFIFTKFSKLIFFKKYFKIIQGIQECINIETTTQIIFPTLITKIQQKLIKDFPINLENIPKQITIKENLTEIMSTTNNIFLNSSTEEYLVKKKN